MHFYTNEQFYFKQFYLALERSINIKAVLFRVIKFSISMHFNSIWPIDTTLSGATTLDQSGPESDVNEEVIPIPQSFIITGT